MNPLVSVIVPCYNQGRYLSEAIDSILDQTYSPIEIIVVDDGSTDNTSEVAQRYASLIKYVFQNNQGLSAARNTGIKNSSGEYLQFLDSDDRLEPDKIRVQADLLNQHPEIGIVYGDVRYFTDGNPDERKYGFDENSQAWVINRWYNPSPFFTKLLINNVMAVNCALVRCHIFERVGFFDERLRAVEDWEFWIRCASKGIVFYFIESPESFALVRSHLLSMSRDQNRMDKAFLDMRLIIAQYINDRNLRTLNCKQGIKSIEKLGEKDRIRRYFRLAVVTKTLTGFIAVTAAIGFGKNSLGYPLRLIIARTIPRPIKKYFLRIVE